MATRSETIQGYRQDVRTQGRPDKKTLKSDPNESLNYAGSFVVINSPHPRFLLKFAETGQSPSFIVGQEKWTLTVQRDKDFAGDILYILMKTIDSNNNNLSITYGIYTDPQMQTIRGVVMGIGDKVRPTAIDPINFKETTRELKEEKFRQIADSLKETQSPERTSDIQRVRVDRVAPYAKRHRLLLAA